jgi:hypothetical protein
MNQHSSSWRYKASCDDQTNQIHRYAVNYEGQEEKTQINTRLLRNSRKGAKEERVVVLVPYVSAHVQ